MNPINIKEKTIHPSKVVCIGRNYVDHIKELNNEIPIQPVIFVKPNSAITNELCFNEKDAIHYEGEISFVLEAGKLTAVGFGLDLTKREVQSKLKTKGLPWERAKAFDGAAVFSDFVGFNDDINNLRMELWINGELNQAGGCELMMLKPNAIIKEIQTFMTLEDGDIIMTGTPKGVGAIAQDDVFIGRIFADDKLVIEQQWVVQ